MIIRDKVFKIDNVTFGCGCSEDEIKGIESDLDMVMPLHIREYLEEFGWLKFGDVIWAGRGLGRVMDIVDITLKERKVNKWLNDKVVLEKNDKYLIAVNEIGIICMVTERKKIRLCNRLDIYLDKLIESGKVELVK